MYIWPQSRKECSKDFGLNSDLISASIDRDEPVSATVQTTSTQWEGRPFVLRFQPHLVLQSPSKPIAWADVNSVEKAW